MQEHQQKEQEFSFKNYLIPISVMNLLFGISLFLFLLIFAVFKINDPDTLQYLADGKLILSHGLGANFCSFNYVHTVCQQAYIHEWLFYLLTYVVYLAGKWNGLVLLQIVLVIATFIPLFLTARIFRYSILSAGIFFFLAVLVGMDRFMLRADLFGLMMTTWSYFILRYYIETKLYEKKTHVRYLIPLLLFLMQVVWTNTHASFYLPFLFIGAYFFSNCISFTIDRWKYKKKETFLSKKFYAILLIFGITLVGSLVNPFGLMAFFYDFTFLHQFGPILHYTNLEWMSPYTPSNFYFLSTYSITLYKFVLVPIIILPFIMLKKIRFPDIFILLAFLYLSVSYVRNTALYALFIALIMPYYLDKFTIFWGCYFEKTKQSLLLASIGKVLCMSILIISSLYIIHDVMTNNFYITDQQTRRFGFGLSENVFPAGAATFVEKNNLKGNMFNDFGIGTYLNWRFYPARKTFIDGDTFSPQGFILYHNITTGKVNYNIVARRYGINYFILNHVSADTGNLIQALYRDKKWKLVYFDEVSVVFVANTSENKGIINKYAITFDKSNNYNLNQLPTFKEPADIGIGYLNRGVFLSLLGLNEDANKEFQNSVKYSPDNFLAYSGLGTSYFQLGKRNQAQANLQKALDLGSNFAPNYFNLGVYYYITGQYNLAQQQFNQTLVLDSTYPKANYLIGLTYQQQGDTAYANTYFEKEQEITASTEDEQKELNASANFP
jgi:tetratricopeptide (TPR) repeat protein